MTQRSTTIRIPIIVDEQGNCYIQAWAHGKHEEGRSENYDGMEEQSRELHALLFHEEAPRTVQTVWATIQVPLPQPEIELPGTWGAE